MTLTAFTPNLFTHDVARSTAFYRDVLGFSVVTTVPPDAEPHIFVLLKRDAVTIFVNDLAFTQKEGHALPSVAVGTSGVTLFLHVDSGIADLWNGVRDRAPVLMPLVDQWYGMTEFSIADPDGYVVTFAQEKG